MARRILVSAYACEPGKGSEQGVGWNWVLQLARCGDVTVITRANNREVIESALAAMPDTALRFVYYDLPAWARRFKRGERGLYLYYLLWQVGAYIMARRLLRDVRFDHVVALTFGSIWMPTFMQFLGVPFIWGPIGGGEAVPKNLLGALPLKARLMQRARYFLFGLNRVNPMARHCMRRASAILVRTMDTAVLIPDCWKDKCSVILETAVAEEVLKELDPTRRGGDAADHPPGTGPTTAIYTGRLIGLKNVPVALFAVAESVRCGRDIRLVIVGDGPERQRLEALARTLEIAARVEFRGKRPLPEVLQALRDADIYLFPSLKEGGVWSLMEAMAAGLPVICMETSGMAVITSDECAIRIPPMALPEVRQAMAEALVALCDDPGRRRAMGEAGRQRILDMFRWSEKGEFIEALLARIEARASSEEGLA